MYPDVASACDATLRERERVAPDAGRQAVYERYYEAYRALYPALRESMGALSALATELSETEAE